jgi:hypothetical protein
MLDRTYLYRHRHSNRHYILRSDSSWDAHHSFDDGKIFDTWIGIVSASLIFLTIGMNFSGKLRGIHCRNCVDAVFLCYAFLKSPRSCSVPSGDGSHRNTGVAVPEARYVVEIIRRRCLATHTRNKSEVGERLDAKKGHETRRKRDGLRCAQIFD